MEQAMAQMTAEERKAFLQYLSEQEEQTNREMIARLVAEEQERAGGSLPNGVLPPLGTDKAALLTRLWGLILGSLPDSDATIMKKAFPAGWVGYGDLSRRRFLDGLSRLTRAEQRRLPKILDQISVLEASMSLATEATQNHQRVSKVRQRRRAAQKGLQLSDDDEDDGEEAARPGSMAELISTLRRRLEQQPSASSSSSAAPTSDSSDPFGTGARTGWGDRNQQPGASTSGRDSFSNGNGNGSGMGAAFGMAGIPESLQGRLGKMMAAYDQYGSGGWSEAEAGRTQSAEMRSLIRLHGELAELVEQAGGGPPGRRRGGGPGTATAAAAAAALAQRGADLAAEVAALLEPGARERLQDPSARAVVRYIETQMVGLDEDGEPSLALDASSVGRLGQFLTAAGNWEAYRAFMALYSERHPELALEGVMQAAGFQDGEEWWARLPEALTAADQQAEGEASTSPALLVDWPRVEAVAALDVDTLSFLTELEATQYSEDTFMKYYFHPVIGPRIRSGALLDPDSKAAAGSAMSGLGVDVEGLGLGAAGAGGAGGAGGSLDPAALLMQLAQMGISDGAGGAPGMVAEAAEELAREQARRAGKRPGPARRQPPPPKGRS
ncbi:hypothetical protein HYH03_007605 [Edaphochlamys debaryana]|uniref:Uncharacterized protein n=1 Tax=Edaphochlamys debaryana TaxID=47281 RepID=A0A835Y1Q6_9CHLO|nr:hypothetical protein HYH03_007605 [Edaphochlamys debaryana]|eukprot:KAG2494250.1 hypothetical protein HYH03_007605 [Edaphochlamys debaryana]